MSDRCFQSSYECRSAVDDLPGADLAPDEIAKIESRDWKRPAQSTSTGSDTVRGALRSVGISSLVFGEVPGDCFLKGQLALETSNLSSEIFDLLVSSLQVSIPRKRL